MSGYTKIPAGEIKKISDSSARILDVRTPLEHETQRLLRMHDHVPIDMLDPDDFMLRRGLDRNAPVYFLCRSGVRAAKAAERFSAAGYKNLYVIEGGILACESGGEPVSGNAAPATGTKVISLERQVRIVAGALVALGAAGGYALTPFLYLLSFAVGLGLVYAGVTDRCGMALVLTRAPWNKTGSCSMKQTAIAPDKPTAGGCA